MLGQRRRDLQSEIKDLKERLKAVDHAIVSRRITYRLKGDTCYHLYGYWPKGTGPGETVKGCAFDSILRQTSDLVFRHEAQCAECVRRVGEGDTTCGIHGFRKCQTVSATAVGVVILFGGRVYTLAPGNLLTHCDGIRPVPPQQLVYPPQPGTSHVFDILDHPWGG